MQVVQQPYMNFNVTTHVSGGIIIHAGYTGKKTSHFLPRLRQVITHAKMEIPCNFILLWGSSSEPILNDLFCSYLAGHGHGSPCISRDLV